MQKIILAGRLTRDAEVRYSQGDNPMCIGRTSIAVNRRFKREGEPDADFFNLVGFGKQGEFLEKYGRKGVKFNVVGRVQTGSYTNKEGQKVNTFDVVIEEIEFGESKNAAQSAPQGAAPAQQDGFVDIPEIDEDLPFN